ncbi:MAG: arylsulfatase [Planctomycetia bacterium]|nr:arylsulfatase [Planctomycetia bacterium]
MRFLTQNKIRFWSIILFLGIIMLGWSSAHAEDALSSDLQENKKMPNVIIILADDLGIGDLSCYGAKVLQTPNLDKLAAEGLKFNRGYATSATCTPSRYALISGLYPIRNPNASILPGNSPLIIDVQKINLPRLFKKAGYQTAAVGKWHLGLADGHQDWNKEIKPGLNNIGFDYSFIMAATNDRTPTVYIENQHVVGLESEDPLQVSYKQNFPGEPTGRENPELLTKMKSSHGHADSVVNGVGRIGFQKGGVKARWRDEDMADIFSEKAKQFVTESTKNGKPFFLYFALHQPHVPRIPHERFVGKTPLGPRGDVIVELDDQVGRMVATLEELGQLENTLIVFSSDNGMVLNDGYIDMSVVKNNETGHAPSGILRGGKYSRHDGGMHVPFIVYWKGKIEPGVTDAIFCQVDFLSTFAALTGQDIPMNVDSENHLDALLGEKPVGRTELLLESSRRLSYRTDQWFFVNDNQKPELFDLSKDPSQKKNVAEEYPEVVQQFQERVKNILDKNLEKK